MNAVSSDYSIGMVSEKERDNLKHKRTRKEQQIDTEHQYEQMESKTPSERARRWFQRPAYSIRGDTSGQAKIKSISSASERDS